MKSETSLMLGPDISRLIHCIRDQRVILDSDLASIYGVPTYRLNEQFRRNPDRFPKDFAFQLTRDEWAVLKSQASGPQKLSNLRSQIAISSSSHGGRRSLPIAFTEHGALMAANILSSPRAVTMSVYVIRAFVKMREDLVANAAILKRLAEIDKTLLIHDVALREIWEKLRPLLAPPPAPPPPPPRCGGEAMKGKRQDEKGQFRSVPIRDATRPPGWGAMSLHGKRRFRRIPEQCVSHSERGSAFTLLELLVVIAITALLAALMLPSLS